MSGGKAVKIEESRAGASSRLRGAPCASDAALRASAPGLKEKLAEGRRQAETVLREKGGRACAEFLSAELDAILRALFDGSEAGERNGSGMSLLAVGGYGRGMLAPHSDIDLLFVLPARQTPDDAKQVERVLYALWDLGLKVGHATRTVDECLELSLSDMTIRTAILEARRLGGSEALFERLMTRFDREVVAGTGARYAREKLAERDERHRRVGESRYLVEPNLKDGKGGLRDLQTLFWIGKYFYRVRDGAELVEKGAFTADEYARFLQAEDFLWAVRCHMHFLAGKAEERLHFDIQREIASRMGYEEAGDAQEPGMGFSLVERFMKAYFLTAKEVGDLTRIFCAALEAEQAKPVWSFGRFFRPRRPRAQKLDGDFLLDNGRVNISGENAFQRDPVNMLRLFWMADRERADVHPDALKLLTRSWSLVDRRLRGDGQANRLFLDLLTSERDPELNLRRMNEAGLLGRLIPAFGEITAMMQFSLYHHYTVDEHLIRCVGVLSELEKGGSEDIHPLSHSLMPDLKHLRVPLYVAVLLHDVAKSSADHSAAGAALARKICPAMGLSAEDTETVAWLIEHHLLMSMTAQTRDLTDRKTIDDFSAVVQTVERLKLLLVLTVCDIRGVGPGVWNGWKGQLLRTLYGETELLLTGGFSEVSRAERGAAARAALEEALGDWDEPARKALVALHYDNYLLSVDLETQIRHARFIRDAEGKGKRLAISVETRRFEAVTVITVLAPDHPRLLSVVAGACAAAGGNIVSASIFTTTDGRALDTILIAREFDRDEDESRRAERVGRLIEDVLSGKARLRDVIAKRAKPKRGAKAFSITPQAVIRNSLSNRFSVVEVTGLDRPGLLSEITGALSDLSLDIASAHITTFGEKAVDTFYVTDLTGAKIENPARQDAVRDRLVSVLASAPLRPSA